jgi:hypothetical protein
MVVTVPPRVVVSRRLAARVLAAFVGLSLPAAALPLFAQDLPPPGETKPKPKPKPPKTGGGGAAPAGPAAPAPPALLLSADMPCTVTIDGTERHHISGAPKKVNVSIGQHLLSAVSDDGRLKWEQIVETKGAGQQVVVQIKLTDAAGTRPEDFDKAAAGAWLAISDVMVAGQYVNSVLNKSWGFHDMGLSTAVHTAGEHLKRQMEEFGMIVEESCEVKEGENKFTPSDAARKRVLGDFERVGKTACKYVNLVAQSITAAQAANSFMGEPQNLLAQAKALEPALVLPPETVNDLKGSQAFAAALPVDKRVRMGLSNDPRDVRLGADYYQSTPTMLAVVDKGGLADKMGFKAGDRIISVSGQPIASIWDFKLMLRANAGKKLSVLVERKGKQETVGASVPSQLP